MALQVKLLLAYSWRSCNMCTRRDEGLRIYEVTSDDPDRNLTLALCEVCLEELMFLIPKSIRSI